LQEPNNMSEPTAFNALSALSRQIEDLAEAAARGVVGVSAQGHALASGFIWRPGTVVTAASAVEADDRVSVVLADKSLQAQVAGRDPSTGIAVLRVADGLPEPARLPMSPGERVGRLVLALGRGEEGVIAALGMVAVSSGPWQSRRLGSLDRLVRLDMDLVPRAIGGIVVDGEGRLIGMPLLGPRQRTVVVPTPTIERVAAKLLADGRIDRGYLGVGLHPIRLDDALAAVHGLGDPHASMVISLDPEGPARKAGVLVGDVIVGFNGTAVPGLRSLLGKLTPESVGSIAELKLLRAGQIAGARVAITARPAV
jgi:S1-C subfamily serine protease